MLPLFHCSFGLHLLTTTSRYFCPNVGSYCQYAYVYSYVYIYKESVVSMALTYLYDQDISTYTSHFWFPYLIICVVYSKISNTNNDFMEQSFTGVLGTV